MKALFWCRSRVGWFVLAGAPLLAGGRKLPPVLLEHLCFFQNIVSLGEASRIFGQWWMLSCAFLDVVWFDLSCIVTYRSFLLVSFFLLR